MVVSRSLCVAVTEHSRPDHSCRAINHEGRLPDDGVNDPGCSENVPLCYDVSPEYERL
jgi:hypothetical protein